MKYYLGIDLGGTKVRVAKVDDNANIVKVVSGSSFSKESAETIRDNIIQLINEIGYEDCEGVGIGVPGPVDTIRNVMTMANNIPNLLEYPLADEIKKATGLNVYLDNDANVAGLAEAMCGAGKGKRIVYYFTHSTGIGGALIFNGKVISGRNGYAGEIGNIIIDTTMPKTDSFNGGALEPNCAGPAILRNAQKAGLNVQSTREVFDLFKNKDPKAVEVIETMTLRLARMMSAVSHICDPDCYVIGGGVSNAHDLYFDLLKTNLNNLVHEGMRDVPIYKAELKEPGVIGAAMLVKYH